MAHKTAFLFVLVLSICVTGRASVQNDYNNELEQRKTVIRILFADLELPRIEKFDAKTMVPFRQTVHEWTLKEGNNPSSGTTRTSVVYTYPRMPERILRSSVSKFEIIQQPETVLLQSGALVIPAQNPDSVLIRYSVLTNYGELIPSISDVQAQADAMKKYGTDEKSICGNLDGAEVSKTKLNCILRLGTANRFGRGLSGVKATFNYGQNPKVQQSLIVEGTAAANKNFSVSGQIDFDPKNLFLTGSDWNIAYSTARIYGSAMESALRQKIRNVCNLDAKKDGEFITADKVVASNDGCAKKLAGPTGWKLAGVFLVPQTTYIVRNQFDFIKQNGALIAAPFPTTGLQDVTFSLDLTRVFPSAKARTDALATLANFKRKVGLTNQDAKVAVEKLYLQMMTNPNEYLQDEKWYQGLLKSLVDVYQSDVAN